MEALLTMLAESNAKTEAWIWAGLYVLDEQHWIDRGITTIEEFNRDEALTSIYEITKDVFHYRPDMSQYDSMTQEQLDEVVKGLSADADREFDEERRRKAEAFARFEGRIAEIQSTVSGASKEDALRILIEAEDCTQDVEWYGYESLEYTLGLAFDSINRWLKD